MVVIWQSEWICETDWLSGTRQDGTKRWAGVNDADFNFTTEYTE